MRGQLRKNHRTKACLAFDSGGGFCFHQVLGSGFPGFQRLFDNVVMKKGKRRRRGPGESISLNVVVYGDGVDERDSGGTAFTDTHVRANSQEFVRYKMSGLVKSNAATP
jgi:hypothetical protein